MPGMPASNKVATIVGVTVLDCADGKIKHVADYYDMVLRCPGHGRQRIQAQGSDISGSRPAARAAADAPLAPEGDR